jgi:hypothetical protein
VEFAHTAAQANLRMARKFITFRMDDSPAVPKSVIANSHYYSEIPYVIIPSLSM